MNYFKAFIGGLVVPAVIIPFGMLILSHLGNKEILTSPSLHFLPIFWGIWNVLYFLVCKWVLYVVNVDTRMYIWGALLGLLVAIVAIFWIHAPESMGMTNLFKYSPLIAAPIIYAIVWRYIVKPINEMLELKN